jgi:hypothetical protein
MGVIGQRHASATLSTASGQMLIAQEAGRAPETVWTREEYTVPHPAFDPRIV